MSISICVTKDHILQGNVGKCRSCPVALAINDVLRSGYYAHVATTFITIRKDGWIYKALMTPLRVQSFIFKFDENPKRAKPFTFKLKLSEEVLCGKEHK